MDSWNYLSLKNQKGFSEELENFLVIHHFLSEEGIEMGIAVMTIQSAHLNSNREL